MAMEIKNSKQLHKHAVPVALVVMIMLVAASGYGHDLFKRVIKIQPSANGLARITVEKTASPKLSDANQAGRTASLTVELR